MAQSRFGFAWLGTLILFVLLALELADRVTMKRDLEIAREIQQWLVPNEPPQVPGIDIAFATRPQNTVAGDYYDAFLRPVPDAVPKTFSIGCSCRRRGEKRPGRAADGYISVGIAHARRHARLAG